MKILTALVSIPVPSPPTLTHYHSGSDTPPRTPAELAREKKLRDDPMAEVHGPLFVTCKRCSSRIKLSPKSSYDPFHWMKHRERCLRKPVGVARVARRTSKDIVSGCFAKAFDRDLTWFAVSIRLQLKSLPLRPPIPTATTRHRLRSHPTTIVPPPLTSSESDLSLRTSTTSICQPSLLYVN